MDPISAQLIRDAIEGDQKAYAEIVQRYRNQIYSLILRMVRRREEAEDLTQETFIKEIGRASCRERVYHPV